jgi:hypothetical protein
VVQLERGAHDRIAVRRLRSRRFPGVPSCPATARVSSVTPRDFRNGKDYHRAVTLQVSRQAATVRGTSAARAAHISVLEPQR